MFKQLLSNLPQSRSSLTRFKSSLTNTNLKKVLENMPKEPKHIADAQRQRLKIKEKNQKYVPGKVTLQVLGTGAEGAPKALYMFTDQSRYLFNCGEGTQRLAHEHKMKLSKLEHIFITHPTWDNTGGLPGVSLTIQDVGVPQITLHGPEGLDELFIATRRFVVLKDLTIRMAECKPNVQFEDNVMSVIYVPIIKSETCSEDFSIETDKSVQVGMTMSDASTSTRSTKKKRRSRSMSASPPTTILEDDTDYYAHEISGKRQNPETLSYELSNQEREQNIVMCYVCRLNSRPGALSLERCVEAGVPPGPLLGLLKAGKDITLSSGVVVKSQDVCLPDDPGPIMIIADCPSEEYLDSFVGNQEFVKYQSTAQYPDDLAYIVVHFTPSRVMKHPRYRDWIDKFSLSTQHLILNDENQCMGSIAVHRIQHKLHMLHTKMFPLLGDKGTEIISNAPAQKKIKTGEPQSTPQSTPQSANAMMDKLQVRPSTPDHFIQANTFCNVYLRPKKGISRSDELTLDPSEYIDETMSIEGFSSVLEILKSQLKEKESSGIQDYPRVLFLGTGSCIPNKTRNTSGILIETSKTSCFLMDCGEGTYGQIVRFFGYEKAKEVLMNLQAVYVSHLHADHHIGLVGLLKGRQKIFKNLKKQPAPLTLIAPRQILFWLDFYHRRFENIADDYELIASGDMILDDCKLTPKQLQKIELLGMTKINTVLVKHCPNAFGVAFTHKNGWKLTYSGDTMPSENLVKLGLNSDLLIHEATMEDELAHEAITKMHSTTSQAITIGQKMNAKHILLTHFSQRYAKLPRFNDNFKENVGIAFDNMQVRMDELPLVPLLYPALLLMFAEHYEELEHKAVKRQLRQERQDRSRSRERAIT